MSHASSESGDAMERSSAGPRIWLILLMLLAFAYFVWPTPWQYLTHQSLATRIHRATGHAQVLTGDGWRSVRTDDVDPRSAAQIHRDLAIARETRTVRQDQRILRQQARGGRTPPVARRQSVRTTAGRGAGRG